MRQISKVFHQFARHCVRSRNPRSQRTPRRVAPKSPVRSGLECLETRQLLAATPIAGLSDEFDDSSTLQNWSRINEVEGWNADQLETIDVDTTQAGRLTMIPQSVVWYQDYRGPLVFKEVSGDFAFTTQVHVRDRDDIGGSDDDLVPGDGDFSLGGVMIRTPRDIESPADWNPGSRSDDGSNNGENYVFLSLGYGDQATSGGQNQFSLEVKTTRNSDSQLQLTGLGPDANVVDIQIARVGTNVFALYRVPGQEWQVHRRYDRPDMPDTIQVGLVTYTDWEKANDFDPAYHNANVLTPDGFNPTPDNPFNPDLEAGFEFARIVQPDVPDALGGVDLLTGATDEQLLSFLGEAANVVDTGESPVDPEVPIAPEMPGDVPEMAIGMNLTMVNDWTHSWIFKDAFKLARTFTTRSVNTTTFEYAYNGAPEMDEDGWVTSLPADTVNENGETISYWADSILFSQGGNPAGTYRAEWSGEGEIYFDATILEQGVDDDGRHFALLDIAEDQTLHVRIYDTNPDDYIRDIQLLMPDYEGQSLVVENWQPGGDESPFHPLYLERLQPFDTLRFMQWQHVNADERPVLTADDLRPVTHANQGSTSRSTYNGVSVEYMVQLVNDLESNAWFNMPHQADDSYVQAFAEYVRDNIHDDAVVHIEYSNEVWNFAAGFEANGWIGDQMELPENEGLGFVDVWAQEARRDFAIWSEVFAGHEDRLVRVAAGQQNNPWLTGQLLQRMNGEFDAVSSTSYAGLGNSNIDWVTESTTQDEIIDWVLENSVAWSLQTQAAHVELADQYSQDLGRDIQFLTYEGGSHLDAFGTPFEALIHSVQDHPRFREIYATLLNGMEDLGVGMHTQYVFSSNGAPSPWGEFGVLHEMDTPMEDAHEYNALADFISGDLDRPLQSVSIAATDSVAHEAGDSGEFTITRSGGLATTDLVINYTISGTATEGVDYEALTGTAVIPAGEVSTTVNVAPILDSNVSSDEGTETIHLTLAGSTDYIVSESSAATVDLLDNEFLTIADQTVSHDASLTIGLPANDAFGTGIDYSVSIGGDLLFTLNQQYSLNSTGNYYTDYIGSMEKWIRGTTDAGNQDWFFILPNGDFGQAVGGFEGGFIANVGVEAYDDPTLLYESQAPATAVILGEVLTITPAAGYVGDFEVTLNQIVGSVSSASTFEVAVTNSAPVLESIADQTHSIGAGSIIIPLEASDADNDLLNFETSISGPAGLAAQLSEQFSLMAAQHLTNFGLDWGGQSEKWINGDANEISNGWYFILPDGSLNAWGGSFDSSTQLAELTTDYYDDPLLLIDAVAPTLDLEVVDSNLVITPVSDTGTFEIEVTVSDGIDSSSTIFGLELTNAAPELSIADQTATAGVPMMIDLATVDTDGQQLSYTIELLGDELSALDAEYGFHTEGEYWTNYLGQNERWIRDSDNNWFYLQPNGELHRWEGSFDSSPLIITLNSNVYEDPSLLTDSRTVPVTVSNIDGVLHVFAEEGYSGTVLVRVTVSDGYEETTVEFNVAVSGSVTGDTDAVFASFDLDEV